MRLPFLFLVLMPIALFSQTKDYASLMDDPSANFTEIQKSFQTNWANKDRKSKGKGFKAFKRWEYFHQNRLSQNGKINNNSVANFQEYKAFFGLNKLSSLNRIVNSNAVAGTWNYIGPANGISTNGGAGRTNFIRFDPNNSSIIYTGSPAGGLWKSTNGGQSWSPLADEFASIGCSDIVIDPNNSNILYLATGDSDGKDTYSIGVLKSIDGGLTWSATGLMYSVNQSYTIAKLLIDPNNSQVVYAATSNGLMKTTDGGVNWVSIKSNGFKDIEFKPFNSNTIYATNGASFWYSKDAGITWSATPTNFGVSIGRSCIAVTPADSNYIYILGSLGANGNADDYGFGGIVRSTNGGQSFSLRSSTPNVMGWSTSGNDQGGQGWYDLALACSPTNKDVIFTGGVNIWKSTNGGSTMTNCSNWWGSGTGYVHADQHNIEFFPGSGTTVFVANDGGVFKSTNTGSSWTDISNGLKIAQQYNLGVSQTNSLLTLTGWQDNGSNLHNGSSSGEVLGGDGFECIISHANANEMYAELYYGDISKSTNGGSSFSNIVNSGGTGVNEDGAWNTPYIQHPTNPGTLLVGKSQVYRTTNGGSSWSQVGTLTNNGSLSKMAYAPSNPNYIYVTNGAGLWVSTNGSSFTNKTNLLPALNITGFAIDPTNPNIVYCSSSGYSSGNKVFLTTDAGNTWTNYSAGLPNVPCNHIVFQNNTYDALYLATDIGVFYRDSTMNQWMAYSNGLPNTIVSELEIQVSTGKLRASTYGRGLWETDLFIAPTSAPVASFYSNISTICKNQSVDFYDSSTQLPNNWSWTFSGGSPATSSLQFPTVTYSTAGTYLVKLVAGNSMGTDSIISSGYITVNDLPVANAGADVTICKGDTIQLSASGGIVYTWAFNTSMNNLFVSNPLTYPTSNKNYMVTVRDSNGCKANDYINVNVIQPFSNPNISANGNQLNVSPANSILIYQWFWNGNPINNSDTSSIAVDSAGVYTVLVSDTSGCFSITSAPFVYVGMEETINSLNGWSIYPNPTNETVFIKQPKQLYGKHEIRILNTEGRTVCIETADFTNEKSYTLKENLPGGSYFVYITDFNTKDIKAKGKLIVIKK